LRHVAALSLLNYAGRPNAKQDSQVNWQ